jgi:hypothetical protein
MEKETNYSTASQPASSTATEAASLTATEPGSATATEAASSTATEAASLTATEPGSATATEAASSTATGSITERNIAKHKSRFQKFVQDNYSEQNSKSNSMVIDRAKHARIVKYLKDKIQGKNEDKTFREYVKRRNFQLLNVGENDPPVLVIVENSTTKKVAIVEDFYDILKKYHNDVTTHGGVRKTHSKNYNI